MIIKRQLTKDIFDSLDGENVKAVEFAEVGAQGNSASLTIVSRDGDTIFMDGGSFGYEFCGTRFSGDVEIEDILAILPFLRSCVGVSPQTTVRGYGVMGKDKRWFHCDTGFGNHLLVLKAMITDFGQRIKALPGGNADETSSVMEVVYWNGLRIVGEMLEEQGEGK